MVRIFFRYIVFFNFSFRAYLFFPILVIPQLRVCGWCQQVPLSCFSQSVVIRYYYLIILPLDLKADSILGPLVRSLLSDKIHIKRFLSSSSASLALFFKIGYSSIFSTSRSLFLAFRFLTSWRSIFSRLLQQRLHIAVIKNGKCGCLSLRKPTYGMSSI